jgi:hypothetical protein
LATAASLATAIEKELGIVPDLKKGPVGLFDVYVDDGVVYSNRREGGRLPRNEEIIEKLRKYQARPARPTMRDEQAKQEVSESAVAGSGCT